MREKVRKSASGDAIQMHGLGIVAEPNTWVVHEDLDDRRRGQMTDQIGDRRVLVDGHYHDRWRLLRRLA